MDDGAGSDRLRLLTRSMRSFFFVLPHHIDFPGRSLLFFFVLESSFAYFLGVCRYLSVPVRVVISDLRLFSEKLLAVAVEPRVLASGGKDRRVDDVPGGLCSLEFLELCS